MIIGKKKVATRADLGVIDGLVPPHDLDAEAAILAGCMLAGSSALTECADVIRPHHFYSGRHGTIFDAIVQCGAAGEPVDAVTVGSRLKNQHATNEEHDGTKARIPLLAQVGGMAYILEIMNATPAIANVRAYAVRVVEHWKLRQVILTCRTYAARGYDRGGDTAAFLGELESEIFKLGADTVRGDSIEILPLLRETYDALSAAYKEDRPPGIATGFGALDDYTAGLHRKDLTLIAARPGVGKTAIMLAMAISIAGCSPMLLGDDGKPWTPPGVAFFSLEMPREQIGRRIIAIDSKVSAQRMRTGRIDDADWSPMVWTCQRLSKVPLTVDDGSALTIGDARTKVRRIKAAMAKKGVRLTAVFFDYLQLMRGDGTAQRREEEIGQISRGLKALAKDEDIAAVAGCQLNRAVESRAGADKKPRIADLRESGNLEQDADNVLAIHRPAMLGEKDPEGEEGRTEVIILKQRAGPVGTAVIRYIPGCTRFEPMPGY